VIRLFKYLILLIFVIPSQAQSNYILQAKAFELKKMPDSSLLYLTKALELKPNNIDFVMLKADLFYKTSNFDSAIFYYEQANKTVSGIGNYGLTRVYARKKDYPVSLKYLEKHLDSKYRLPEAQIKLDAAFRVMDKEGVWTDLWNKEWYSKYDDQVRDATFMLNNKDYEGVILYVNGLVKSGSKKHELMAIRAKAYFELANYNTAVFDYSIAISASKKNPDYYYERALAYDKLKNYKQAVDDYSQVILFEPSMFSAYLKRAADLRLLGKYTDAAADVDFYLSFFSDDDGALYISGLIAFDMEYYIKSLDALSKAIKFDSTKASYYETRAKVYEKNNLLIYAEKDYTKALTITPNNAEAYFNRGNINYALGNKNDACADWKKATAIGHYKASENIQRYCK
jgi:tetratricopeptide (TPR) repeat protein